MLVETKGTTGEETISYWFELPIDIAEFEEKLGVGAESGDYRIIEKVLPFADEVHEHTSVYQLNELDLSDTENWLLPDNTARSPSSVICVTYKPFICSDLSPACIYAPSNK